MPQNMSLGDRMKHYESSQRLKQDQAVIIRVDGQAFHTWTKRIKARKPFDSDVQRAMEYATQETLYTMQAARLAYTQSDESTFCLLTTNEKEQGWFGYKVQKLVSLTASVFTWCFNSAAQGLLGIDYRPAYFDARAYSVPVQDAANVFVWRQQDCERNSIQALGQTYFSHKDMQGKSNKEVLTMLAGKNIGLDNIDLQSRYGVFVYNNSVLPSGDRLSCTDSNKWDYAHINRILGIVDAANKK